MEKGKAILAEGNTKLQVLIEKNRRAFPLKEPEWQIVRRKRSYPNHWRPGGGVPSPAALIPRSKVYIPFQTRPTYAETVANRTSHNTSPTTSPPISPPSSPQSPTYYLSPHSPTPLRFPPSSKFEEWKGKCFRCCRLGHSIAVCRNPPKCGRCWKNGHTGNKCKAANTKQAPMLAGKPVTVDRVHKNEPGFGEMLTEPKPRNPPPMPEGRPEFVRCFVDRDAEYYHEMDRLNRGVVVHIESLPINFDLSVDKVAEWVAQSKLIPESEIVISVLTKKRFLIILPEGLAPETLIKAIPYEVWDEGISFQKWDHTEGVERLVPEFKAIIDLVGIPPFLYREKQVINAVCSFGTYLGTVAQPNQADIYPWGVLMVAGEAKYPIQIKPVKWKKGRVYDETDFPKPPEKFEKPPKPVQQEKEEDTRIGHGTLIGSDEDDDMFLMSRKVLLELCQGRELDTLPLAVRAVIAGEEKPKENSASIPLLTDSTMASRIDEPELPVSFKVTSLETHLNNEKDLTKEFFDDTVLRGTTLEGHQEVRGNKCVQGEVSKGDNQDETQEVLPDGEAGQSSKTSEPETLILLEESLRENVLLGLKQKEPTPRATEQSDNTTNVNESEAEEMVFQGALNDPTQVEGGPQGDLETLAVLRKSVRKAKKNKGLFNQVLGRPKLIMGYKRKDCGAGPSKRSFVKKKERNVDLLKDSEGFFKVHVDFAHCIAVAEGCGVNPQDVEQIIEEDNLQRLHATDLPNSEGEDDMQSNEEEGDAQLGNSDLDSEEEIQSEMD